MEVVLNPTVRATLIYLYIKSDKQSNTEINLLTKDMFLREALYQHALPFFSQFIVTGQFLEVIKCLVPNS